MLQWEPVWKKKIRKIDVGRNDVKLNKIVRKINNTFFLSHIDSGYECVCARAHARACMCVCVCCTSQKWKRDLRENEAERKEE